VIVLAAQAWTLTDYYRTRRWTDEFYTLTNVINSFAQPNDGVLLHTDHDWPVFLYYLRAPVGWDGVLSGHSVDEATAAARAETMVSRFERVWVVVDADALAKDPQHLVEAALAQRLPQQLAAEYGAMKLLLYAREPERAVLVPEANFRPQSRRELEFAPGLRLLGYDFPLREAWTGDQAHLVTYWHANQPTPIQVRLLNAAGGTVATVEQNVPAGERVRVQTDLRVAPGAGGEYVVSVGAGEASHVLARLTATPRFTPGPVAIATPADYALGEAIRLAGYDLPERSVRAGQTLPVTVFWNSTAPVEASYKVFVHLVGEEWNPALGNPLWGQVDRLPVDGNLPTDAWVPGQVVVDRYEVPVQANAPPGRYALTVGLYDALSGERLPVYDATGSFIGDEIVLGEVEVVP
jgi:hypothetical protein